MMNRILVTGGAGYIGSHVCKALKSAGFEPITFDNLSSGHLWAVRWGPLVQGDLQNGDDLEYVFSVYKPKAVIHLAGLVDLRESILNPDKHYENNVLGSLSLFRTMAKHGVSQLIYSSSAAVYGPSIGAPICEDHPKNPLNPYGRTKWITEQLIGECDLNAVIFRYFNAAGSDPDGQIGEAHTPETHLIPRAISAAQEGLPLVVYNNQHPTRDGTAVRDYVHVSDLAEAHVEALDWLNRNQGPIAMNLGSNIGYSVLEVIAEVEKISGLPVDYIIANQKIDEVPSLIADARKAQRELNWTPKYSDLTTMVKTAWKWHENSVTV
ncbi:MAG: UDP-glucose 4-epimerase GalE [Verrucomicrobia bacterium]|nr:UDP-glucose 4-epimerase GalE [Verrucomicrobiota bacterium]